MRIHARRWHFNRTSPIEVVVTQAECQRLELASSEVRLGEGNKEMRRAHAALSTMDWDKEEVKLTLGSGNLGFHDFAIYNASGWWIAEPALTIYNEKALDDALVDD